MDDHTLVDIIFRDSITATQLRGVIAADELQVINLTTKKPFFYVVNTDDSFGPGEHWVVVYVPSESEPVEFWDSLGHSPSFYGYFFGQFFRGKYYIYNTMVLQGGKPVCGHFCIYYAYFRCRGYCLDTIVNSFSADRARNDWMVKEFVEKNI